ncbi:PRC-barrel domain-containing protein [Thermincola ferriacetica]|uniref:PRC-barrel domain-containing protein n=1 Tax=Thermincola ferriacetica TaxID=281456 RepID=A0A0L6W6G1_9FIRM|nr:PRC-barrel domain-containing protein [Thermincola ferriacetica]KNZ70953.1 PRC-barrel domain-containing protein [Thermincola ferriacetica]
MNENPAKRVIRTQEIIGKQVITLQGEDLGAVARVLVDPETAMVAGFTLNTKGWFKGEKAFAFSSVKAIGNYAITLEKKDLVDSLNNLPSLEKLSSDFNIYNTRVITPSGELLGTVEDFGFDADSGKIESFLLSGGVIRNLMQGKALIPVSAITKIGPDVIIAKNNAGESLQKADSGIVDNIDSWKENLQAWKGNLDNLKDDVEKGWEVTLSTAKEVSKKLGEKVQELKEEGTDKSRAFFSKTASKTTTFLSDSKNELVSTYEAWMEKLQNFKNRNRLSTDELSALLWKKVGKDIHDNNGNLIIAKDGEVSPEVLDKIQQAGKTKELLLSIATRDVAEKLETLRKDSEEI